ncbi:MAG: hypothetical protein ACR2P9_02215 [Gammaproteobacteria bacterium]
MITEPNRIGDDAAARRKRANIRLAVALGTMAAVIYLGFILLHV